MNTDYKLGLTQVQVEERIKNGNQNIMPNHMTKSTYQIMTENICTRFNLLNFIIAVSLACVGAWSNMFFICIIVMNIIIGIAQELKAKKLVEDLSLLSRPEAVLIRDGKQSVYRVDDIVIDDLMVLAGGNQICCDSVIVRGEVEVNEALITGESDAITKTTGDHLLSGSSVISGKCYAQAERVGAENYASKIAAEAKKMRKINSELIRSMRKVTKVTSFLIVPLGILLFLQAYMLRGDNIATSVVTSSAGLLGMLPKGLVLLISVSLAGGVIKLAGKKVLVQDLYSLESLAHVDMLCLDKTGTLTDGIMKVEKEYRLDRKNPISFDLHQVLSSFFRQSDDSNATFQAMRDFYGDSGRYHASEKIPFSSERKWSSSTLDGIGTIIIGAPERLFSGGLPAEIKLQISTGKRVVIAGLAKGKVEKNKPLPEILPIAGIVISDHVRDNAPKTLQYFKSQGVEVKVISGDNPMTVSAVAKEAGVEDYDKYINMDQLKADTDFQTLVQTYTVFGRTTPLQKKQLVEAMQKNGNCVAMTGDGVNDLLALKEADCSIAVGQGSDAARQVAQVVLLDSDFASLTEVLGEGRRVVHHVTRAAGVFFIKTIYSVILTIICVLCNIPFPFIPIQITFLDAVVEAYPAFLTAFEPYHKKIKGKFLPTALKEACSHAIGILISACIVLWMGDRLGLGAATSETIAFFLVGIISMAAVVKANTPFNKLRTFVVVTMITGYITAIFLFHWLLEIELLSFRDFCVLAFFAAGGLLIDHLGSRILKQVFPS